MLQRKYSAILGNLGNTKDRFCGGYKDNPDTYEMLRRMGRGKQNACTGAG